MLERHGEAARDGRAVDDASVAGADRAVDDALVADLASPAALAERLRSHAGDPERLIAAVARRYGNAFVNEAFALLAPTAAATTATAAPGAAAIGPGAKSAEPAPEVPAPRKAGVPALHAEAVVGGATTAAAKKIAAAKAKLPWDPGFEQVSRRHGLNGRGGAPETIKLPKAVEKALDTLWKDSHRPDGSMQEQGGNLVRNYGGSYEFRREDGFDDSTFDPDYGDVGWTQSLVGVVHTHPYANPAHEGASFSAADMASISGEEESQPLNILRSGDMTFVVARTKEFDKIVARYEANDDQTGLYKAMYDCYENAFAAAEGTFQEKIETAVLAVCKAYHLEYYEGRGATLHRVTGASPP